MKTIYKKKIYNGNVELRDYEIKKLSLTHQPIKIVVKNEYMVLSYDQLIRGGKIVNTQLSQFNPRQTYKLIGYKWNPIPENEQLEIGGNNYET